MPKIVFVAVILAAIAVSGVYFWQNKTVSETNSQIPDQSPPKSNYINTNWKFSLDIPEGYLVQDEEDIFYVVKKPTPDDETPSPELRIEIEKSSQTTMATSDKTIVSAEKVTINGVQGHKTVISYKDYPEGNQCPIYRLLSGGVVYEFSLYECLESAIFETVVQSFKII